MPVPDVKGHAAPVGGRTSAQAIRTGMSPQHLGFAAFTRRPSRSDCLRPGYGPRGDCARRAGGQEAARSRRGEKKRDEPRPKARLGLRRANGLGVMQASSRSMPRIIRPACPTPPGHGHERRPPFLIIAIALMHSGDDVRAGEALCATSRSTSRLRDDTKHARPRREAERGVRHYPHQPRLTAALDRATLRAAMCALPSCRLLQQSADRLPMLAPQ
jgi:hypothetical protein